MVDIIAIKDYLKKLQKIIDTEATFSFANYRLVKKSRIDDLTCCIYAILPDSYKKKLKSKKEIDRFTSILCYSMLTKHLAKTFFLDKNLVLLNIMEINNLIFGVSRAIERDINKIESEM